jgi:glucose/arabinose dehydrogenase
MHNWVAYLSAFSLAALLLTSTVAPVAAQRDGFSLVPVASGFVGPTAFAFKGTQIFVTEKASGRVQTVRADGTVREWPLLTVNVTKGSERGLLGIAVDPDFASNQYVYVYYTTGPGALGYTGVPVNRVSRFRFIPTTATAVDEQIIINNIPSDTGIHNGGDIQFGFDGLLYISVGDGGIDSAAADIHTLRGKILRVNSDGTIPPTNPHRNDPGARRCGRPIPPPGTGPCKEIYAYGFRNPFRFSLRQANSTVIVGDVGQDTWEELDTLVVDKNYGWNAYEGPCPQEMLNCDPSSTDYSSDLQYPIHFYNHTGTGETGRSIIAGAFAENGNAYPAPYKGAYFYGDFIQSWVHVLTLDGSNTVTSQSDFGPLSQPVCFRIGPDGNVYVLSFGGTLYKYVYRPPSP